MAIQKGHIKYVGTLGEVRHFKMKGSPEYFAGLKGGPTKEQVKTDPVFERTRENMNEFAGCARAGKSVRTAFSSLIATMSDNKLTGRLTSIMKKINLEDETEARGYRAILITAKPEYLQSLVFDQSLSFDSIFTPSYSVSHVVDRNEATLTVPEFNPAGKVIAPAGATHFRLINAIGVISDYAFNANTGTYEPLDAANNEKSIVAYSDYLPIDATAAAQSIVATLADAPTLGTDVSVMQVIGVEFSQKVGSNYYAFSSGNCLKTVEVF
ncbi:MAG: hypothetical protein ACO1OO_09545 [Flavisolibacter sp.]